MSVTPFRRLTARSRRIIATLFPKDGCLMKFTPRTPAWAPPFSA